MSHNSDGTYNGKTIRGTTTATSGDSSARMVISFFTEVDNPDGLDVGYPDPSVVAAAINTYASQQGWPDVTFVVESPESLPSLPGNQLAQELGL